MIFLRRRESAVVSEALDLIRRQQAALRAAEERHRRFELYHVRAVRDLVEHFLIAHEEGIDVRDELLDGLRDLSDHVARLEEHV